jgi:hypothetical protein
VTDQETTAMSATVSRTDVVGLLATFGDRPLSAVGDGIDSLELAWLVHQVEQRYHVTLALSDDDLQSMATVDAAVTVLGRAIGDSR